MREAFSGPSGPVQTSDVTIITIIIFIIVIISITTLFAKLLKKGDGMEGILVDITTAPQHQLPSTS